MNHRVDYQFRRPARLFLYDFCVDLSDEKNTSFMRFVDFGVVFGNGDG